MNPDVMERDLVEPLALDWPTAAKADRSLYPCSKHVVILANMGEERPEEKARPGESSAAARWARVRDILDQALQLTPDQRAAFLENACGGDAALRSEVESLIEASAGSAFIDRPVLASVLPTVTIHGESDSAPALPNGQKISHYEITGKIGEGGMGAVYKAVDLNLGRPVALKVISRSAISADDKHRFAREAKAASALNHPNIVTIYEYNSEDGLDFIAMEYVEGVSLDKALHQRKLGVEQPLARLLDYARQVALALGKAHAAGIVHRDLKPGNIMITPEGSAKVLDFGLAKQESNSDEPGGPANTVALTRVGAVLGTPAYMSPEQAMGEAVDFRADIFSFGIILYEIACGQRPFQGSSVQATVRQIAFKDHPPPITLNPTLPAELCVLIDRCLRKEKEERLSSMAEAAAVLSSAASSFSASDPRRTATSTAALPVSAITESGDIAALAGSKGKRSPMLILAACMTLAAAGSLAIPGVRESALARFRTNRAAVKLPKSSQDWYEQGQAYLARYDRKGNQDKAIEAFQKAIEIDRDNAAAYAGLAQAYLSEIRNASADQQLAKLALDAANEAIRINPYLAVGHAAAGGALLNLGRTQEATRSVEHALELDPKNAAAYDYSGAIYAKQGDTARAESSYKQASALAPSDWLYHGRLGTLYYRSGRMPEAVAEFEAAVRLTPDNALMNASLGGAYHAVGRDDDAAAAFQRSLETNPTTRGFSNLGTLLYFMGHYRESAEAFEKSLSLDASSYLQWGNLGDAYRWTAGFRDKANGAYARAIQLVRQEEKKAPGNPDLQSSLAVYLAKSGGTEAALQEAAALGPAGISEPAVLFKLAVVYEICNDRQKALRFLNMALRAGYSVKEVENEPELIALRKDPAYSRALVQLSRSTRK